MRVKDGFVCRSVGETHMAVPVGTRTQDVPGVVALSESGVLLWERLEADATIDDLVDVLLAEYEVERDQAEKDVRAFVGYLSENGLLED